MQACNGWRLVACRAIAIQTLRFTAAVDWGGATLGGEPAISQGDFDLWGAVAHCTVADMREQTKSKRR